MKRLIALGTSIGVLAVGAASYFGNQTVFWATLLSLLVGVVLAYASERLGDVVERALAGRAAEGRTAEVA